MRRLFFILPIKIHLRRRNFYHAQLQKTLPFPLKNRSFCNFNSPLPPIQTKNRHFIAQQRRDSIHYFHQSAQWILSILSLYHFKAVFTVKTVDNEHSRCYNSKQSVFR